MRPSQIRSCAQCWVAHEAPAATPTAHTPSNPPASFWHTLSMHSKSCWHLPPTGTSGVANVELHAGSPARLRILVRSGQVAARIAARHASTWA